MNALAKGFAKGLTTTAIVLVLAEVVLRGAYGLRNSLVRFIPLPYALGDEYGPIPPWLGRLLILQPDSTLIWRSQANARRTYVDIFSPVRREADRIALLRQFVPTLPEQFQANPRWTIALNSHGDRGPEVAAAPVQGTVRIVCVGDSWTFGMNVNQDRTYPSRLEAWLREEDPNRQYEVMNFGVLGYSSYQGLQLLKQRVLDLHPNVVLIGFGMNDSGVPGYRDKDVISPRPRITTRVKDVAKTSEVYKLLDYTALVMKFRPGSIADFIKDEDGGKASAPVNYDDLEPWTRVSPRDYESNVREMIRLARERGASAVLLDNQLWADSPYRPILRKAAAELNVPLVDSFAMIEDAKQRTERGLEASLGLARAGNGPGESQAAEGSTVVFRVYRGTFPVTKMLSIVGVDPQLGALQPNRVAMHDDGKGGDERAGDGVWSETVILRAGARVAYVYTNSGEPGRWEGLDVPQIRAVQVPGGGSVSRPVYLPIDTFGRIYMQADGWHTDAIGYDLIARAAAAAVIQSRPH